MTKQPDTSGPDHNPAEHAAWWHSRRTLAAGAVLVTVAIGAAWTATTGRTEHHATAAYDSACGLHGGTTATPTVGPDVQWQNVDGNWLSVSTTQGPGRHGATGPWSCFAHTPTGAVLAAWDIPARLEPADFAAVVQQQTLPGPGQAALLKQGPDAPLPSSQLPVPTGFRINSYGDGTAATITYYVHQQGIDARCTSAVRWVGGDKGDWSLSVNPDGTVSSSCQQIGSAELHDPQVLSWGPNS